MKTNDILTCIEKKYPQELQENWDSSGLVIDYGKDIKKILVCLDVSPSITKYAIENNVNLIISHHPMIFMDYVTTYQYLRDCFQDLYAAKVALYSMHTNYDNNDVGMNALFIKELGYRVINTDSMIKLFECDETIYDKLIEFSKYPLRIYNKQEDVKKAAVVLGSGGSFIEEATHLTANIFISSEFKHHEILYAKEHKLTLVDISHQAEEIFINDVTSYCQKYLKELEIIKYSDNYTVE